MKPMMLKKGTQVCSGRNFCAKASAMGEVIQLTFMTGMKPARTVARTWWNVRAPAMMAMLTRYTPFWIGAICGAGKKPGVSMAREHSLLAATRKTYNQIAEQDLKDLGLQTGPPRKDLLKNANENVAQGGADEHSVKRHLRHARAEVVAMLADIVGEPRRDEFL
jgi:hypothetical protein